MSLNIGGNLRVKTREYLAGHINDRDLDIRRGEVLRDLKADEAAASYNNALDLAQLDRRAQSDGVLRFSHKKDVFKLDSGQTWRHRARAGRDDQFIIGIHLALFRLGIDDSHRLSRPVKRNGFFAGENVGSCKRGELFRGIDDKCPFVGNDAADIIRQAAARVRDIFILSQYPHLSAAVLSFEFRRYLCARRYAADHKNFHNFTPFGIIYLLPLIIGLSFDY